MSIHIYIFETQIHQRSSLIQRFVEREVCQGCSIEKKGNGKPYLKGAPQGVDLNISHSGNLLCIALSDDGEVGVDIERHRQTSPILGIARRFFSEKEGDYLIEQAPSEREKNFFRLWTLKEAMIKLVGSTIGYIKQFTLDYPKENVHEKYVLAHQFYQHHGLWSVSVASRKLVKIIWHPILQAEISTKF
jgi:phosphopantetheine--protein transferase-like protein